MSALESLSEPDSTMSPLERTIAFGGTSEGKMHVLGIFLTEPDIAFTNVTLHVEAMARQGLQPSWRLNQAAPAKHCMQTLQPGGFVRITEPTRPREPKTFQAERRNPELLVTALAYYGGALEWGLSYPETSLQQMLGISVQRGAFYTPLLRYDILSQVVALEATQPSMAEIAAKMSTQGAEPPHVRHAIKELDRKWIIDLTTIDIAAQTVLEITSPEFHAYRMQLADTKPLTQHFYRAVSALWEQGENIITFQQVADEIAKQDPNFDHSELRRLWSNAADDDGTVFPGIRQHSRLIQASSKRSLVQLHPDHAEAVRDFVSLVESLKSGVANERQLRATARKLATHPASVKEFLQKGRKHSHGAQRFEIGTPAIVDTILSAIQDSGTAHTNHIQETLRDRHIFLSDSAVQAHLRQLVDAGFLCVDRGLLDPRKRVKVNYYSLAEQSYSTGVNT